MNQRTILSLALVGCVGGGVGCTTSITCKQVNRSDAPQGVRWVDMKPYEVFIYTGGPKRATIGKDGPVIVAKPKLIYYGTHELLDSVNGVPIDPNRAIWEVNYEADTFSDGTINLEFHDNGTLKKAKLLGKSNASDALRSATTSLKAKEDIEADKISDIQRETQKLKALKDLQDARKALQPASQ